MTDSVTLPVQHSRMYIERNLIHSIKPVVYAYSSSIVYETNFFFRFHNIKYSVSLKVVFSVRKCIKRIKSESNPPRPHIVIKILGKKIFFGVAFLNINILKHFRCKFIAPLVEFVRNNKKNILSLCYKLNRHQCSMFNVNITYFSTG